MPVTFTALSKGTTPTLMKGSVSDLASAELSALSARWENFKAVFSVHSDLPMQPDRPSKGLWLTKRDSSASGSNGINWNCRLRAQAQARQFAMPVQQDAVQQRLYHF
jgi:hypothetical protein